MIESASTETCPSSTRASHPFHLMAKPAGPACNLDCAYCFYLEKSALFEGRKDTVMSRETLERFVRTYLETHPGPEIEFAWQGGEPTIAGLDFFRAAMELQKAYGGGRTITNALQTNGTLLNDAWGAFLREHNFLVGISIDGPAKLHDRYRMDRGGRPSFDKVMRGLKILQKHGVEYNTLTCVHAGNQHKPLEVYRFLRGAGSRHMQFIPIVERKPDQPARELGLQRCGPPADGEDPDSPVFSWSVDPKAYGDFLCAIFDRWKAHDIGRVHIQHFEGAIGVCLGQPAGLCVFAPRCGSALALEHDGSVYACDHFVYPAHRRGNLNRDDLGRMVEDPAQRGFGEAKSQDLPIECRECRFLSACWGGCPKHRFAPSRDGTHRLNYLCAGYRGFFKHAEPDLVRIARSIAGTPR